MHAINRWFSENVQALARDMRWSYLPPLMVYVAAGIQGLTGIVGTFFVKDYLGLSAEFLAALGFWAFVPWSLKMPIGHLVDLIWRFKAWLVVLGAALIGVAISIHYYFSILREAVVRPTEDEEELAPLELPLGTRVLVFVLAAASLLGGLFMLAGR
jgi:hypothetical protein